MTISQPQYLWLLLLVPLFFIIQAVVLKLRRRRIRRFGDEELVNSLMPSYTGIKLWVRMAFFAVAFCFLVIALSRPQRGVRIKEQQVKGAEVIIALDVSNSMLAEDYSPNRLERAKLAISRVSEKLHDDRIGLIVFAGESYVQIPLTSDYISAKMFLNSISTGSVPVQGTSIGSAIELALKEGEDVMVEAFMGGTEITCGCYKTSTSSHVLPITEVVTTNEFFDYDAKYNGQVEEITPARISERLTQRVQTLTSAIYDILGCYGIIRIDYIITEGEKINLLEINTTPGMTATSFIPQQIRAAGLDIKDVMTEIIEGK